LILKICNPQWFEYNRSDREMLQRFKRGTAPGKKAHCVRDKSTPIKRPILPKAYLFTLSFSHMCFKIAGRSARWNSHFEAHLRVIKELCATAAEVGIQFHLRVAVPLTAAPQSIVQPGKTNKLHSALRN
jgi:hypothetical protein